MDSFPTFTDMCSIIAPTLSSFDDLTISLENYTKANCTVLLIADCSIASTFAVFITPSKQTGIESLQVHIGGEVVTYSTQKNGIDFVQLKNQTEIEVTPIRPLGESVNLRY